MKNCIKMKMMRRRIRKQIITKNKIILKTNIKKKKLKIILNKKLNKNKNILILKISKIMQMLRKLMM
jgi:hypothetical protein